MQNARDVKADSHILRCMVVGKNGSGKSIFASTFPTPGFVFDFDKGILSYRGKDFDYEQFENSAMGWIKFEQAVQAVVKDEKYKTLVLDSTTSMTARSLERAMQLDPKRAAGGNPTMAHYGMSKNLILGYINRLLAVEKNLVVISHVRPIKDEVTGQITFQPLLGGDMPDRIPTMFDEVYYAVTQRKGDVTQYLIQTVSIGYYCASSRLSGVQKLLPDFLPNDYNEIMKYLGKEK